MVQVLTLGSIKVFVIWSIISNSMLGAEQYGIPLHLVFDSNLPATPKWMSFCEMIFSKILPMYLRRLMGWCLRCIVGSVLLFGINTHLSVFQIYENWLS